VHKMGTSCPWTRVRTQLCFVFCVFKIRLKMSSRVQRDWHNCVGLAGPENWLPLTQNLDAKLIFGPDAKTFRTRHKTQNTNPPWTRFVKSCEKFWSKTQILSGPDAKKIPTQNANPFRTRRQKNSDAKCKSFPDPTQKKFRRQIKFRRKYFPDPDPTQKNSVAKCSSPDPIC
jgi:hypothetical protein